jgi:hypothetical protein
MPYVWDYNLKTAQKNDSRYRQWHLERLIAYGLKPGEKLARENSKDIGPI